MLLPKVIEHIYVPPIKCQGKKTKLVNFVANSVVWDGSGIWVEPFMGSGVVGFNIIPERAIFGDINPHIIALYSSLKSDEFIHNLRDRIEDFGNKLRIGGQGFYIEARAEFNQTHNSFLFLMLNRCNFNGLIRFNTKGEYNVPYGHKDDRFSASYVTRICNQITALYELQKNHDWNFVCCDYSSLLTNRSENDFCYFDPPYLGRNTGYYTVWNADNQATMETAIGNLPCGYAISTWLRTRARDNYDVPKVKGVIREYIHRYEVRGGQKHRGIR